MTNPSTPHAAPASSGPAAFRPSRRAFVSGAAALGATVGTAAAAPVCAPRPVFSGPAGGRGGGRDTLVLVYLRGGLDGLSACVPRFEAGALAGLRPGLLVPTGPGSGAVDLDGSFSLHPSLSPLEPLYRDGELGLIHAVGSLDPTRSHFAARRAIDAGAIGAAVAAADGGWLGRALQGVPEISSTAPRGVALGSVLPRTLLRGPRVVPVNHPAAFADYGDASTSARRRAALRTMHEDAELYSSAGTVRHRLGESGMTTVAALDELSSVDFTRSTGSVSYPATVLGGRLKDAATLVLAGIGTEAIHIEVGDWDDHDDMGQMSGDLASRLDDLGRSLAAFRADVGLSLDRTTVLVYSEFGRKASQNGSQGTDHGRGGLAMALGGSVQGGRVLGTWPGLGAADLDDDALAVTTDLRDVFAEVLSRRFGVSHLTGVFPSHTPAPVGLVS